MVGCGPPIEPDFHAGATFPRLKRALPTQETREIHAAQAAEADKLPEGSSTPGSPWAPWQHTSSPRLARGRAGLVYHHGDVPLNTLGDSWPAGVDLQIHVSENDEFFEADVANEFVEQAGAQAEAEIFTYPGRTSLRRLEPPGLRTGPGRARPADPRPPRSTQLNAHRRGRAHEGAGVL